MQKLGVIAEKLGKYDEALDWFTCAHMFYVQREWMERELFCGKTTNWLVGTIIDNLASISRVARRQGDLETTVALLQETGTLIQKWKVVWPSTGHGAEHFLCTAYPPDWRRSATPPVVRRRRAKK